MLNDNSMLRLATTKADQPLLQAAVYVIERATHVSLDLQAARQLALKLREDRLTPKHNQHWLASAPDFAKSYWASLALPNQILFLTIFHTIGFCYWSSEPDGKRWTVKLDGVVKLAGAVKLEATDISKTKYLSTQVFYSREEEADTNFHYDGAIALLISMASNAKFLDLEFLANLDFEQFKMLLAGQWSQNIDSLLLLKERHSLITSLAKKLISSREIIEAKLENTSAPELAQQFADELPGFDDTAFYKGRKIYFLKRAQLLVSDINQVLPIANIEGLTAFADYKLPQFLRHHNVIAYETGLAERIDKSIELLPGSEEEVEIRAATVIAVELIKECLEKNGIVSSAAQIDSQLWLLAQTLDKSMMQPYHRCRTVFY
ncbi:MAG: queuosine salvage family protein [Candidatus Obscuribacterales bacterium]|jgi:hypothetical protein